MGHDRGVQVPEPHPDRSPYDAIPDGDPVQVLEGGYHEGVEGKDHRRARYGQYGRQGRPDRWVFAEPWTLTQSQQTSQQESTEVQLHQDRDKEDAPWQHDDDGEARVWCVPQKIDLAIHQRNEPQDNRDVQNTQDQSDTKPPPQTLTELMKPESQAFRDGGVLADPDRQSQIGQYLWKEQDRREVLEARRERIVQAGCDCRHQCKPCHPLWFRIE